MTSSSPHQQSTVERYFTSSRARTTDGASSIRGHHHPTIPSSLDYARPLPVSSAGGVASAACSAPESYLAASAAASIGSPVPRNRKRDRHADEEADETACGADAVGLSSLSALSAAPAAHSSGSSLMASSKLCALSLVYQLHVLRADEKMLVTGVGDAGAVGMEIRCATEEEEDAAAGEEEEDAKVPRPANGVDTSSSSSCMVDAPELISSEPSVAAAAEPDEVLEPLSAAVAPPLHPLFPESLDFVRFFLSASSAHLAFLRAQDEWRRRGVRNVKERVLELQLTQPVQLLVVASESQRQHWLPSADGTPMEDEQSTPAAATNANALPVTGPTPALRASPFSKAPAAQPVQQTLLGFATPRPAATHAVQATSSSTPAAPTTDATPATSSSSSSLPALYTPPTLSAPLRRLLSRESDVLDGYCVLRPSVESAASAAGGGGVVDLTESTVVDGEVILRASVCAAHMRVIDDDKQGRWHQQLLTDLFGRMAVGGHAAAGAP